MSLNFLENQDIQQENDCGPGRHLDLNGIWGGYQGEGSKTVHPSKAHAKITCRLVANQNPDKIFECLKSHILNNISNGITAQVNRLPGNGDPFLIPRGHNASKVAKDVLTEIYEKEPYMTRLGGTIPVSAIFLKELGVHTTMFGFSIGDENLHAPNEFFRLKNFRRGLQSLLLTFGKIRIQLIERYYFFKRQSSYYG